MELITPFTEEEFLTKTGMELSLELEDTHDDSNNVARFIDKISNMVIRFIKKYNIYFDWKNLSSNQLNAFKEACIEQARYVIINGDLSMLTGYDANANISNRNITNEIKYAPNLYEILNSGRLLNRRVKYL